MRCERRRIALTVALGVVALTVAGCGSQQDHRPSAAATGHPVERAFLQAMQPHHHAALELTEVAAHRARSADVRRIAEGIAATQGPEIERMRKIHLRLFKTPLVPDETAHEQLGLSAREAGMGHGDPVARLTRATAFDRAFLGEMIAHHEGAVRMARAVLARTHDAELRALARGIVTTQEKELEEMKAVRAARYAGDTPAPEVGRGEPKGGHDRRRGRRGGERPGADDAEVDGGSRGRRGAPTRGGRDVVCPGSPRAPARSGCPKRRRARRPRPDSLTPR